MPKLNKDIISELKSLGKNDRAKGNSRFFKTGKGEYGEGDLFWGIKVPDIRKVAKKYTEITFEETEGLIRHPVHEVRMCGLLLLIHKAKEEPKAAFKIYIKNTKHINNWDLVDMSASHIAGAYLFDKDKTILKKLAKSKSLWEKRIAIIATHYFIKRGEPKFTLEIAKILLYDKHDLIHKAVGWMLREVGNCCSLEKEEKFLQEFGHKMPRIMLYYAIEKFSNKSRRHYLELKNKIK